MLRELDYQSRVLETIDAYLDVLKTEKDKADKVARLIAEQPELGIPQRDFAAESWGSMKAAGRLPKSRAGIPYSPRHDGTGRPVPDIVLKVPTGGGKTYLATHGLSRIFGRYLNRNSGFVLWIVPNEAIYAQTLRHLSNRQHPYRQVLDRAAAGRVKIMEKGDPLNAHDVEDQLCVMLLMLQSANRETQDSLRMFRDRGDVHGFFPPEGDQAAHKAAIEATPNLDSYEDLYPMVKDSLGNALRIIRPIVVLDEGHKAVSELAFRTLYGFNPCFVLELTATPQDIEPKGGKAPSAGRYANVLVEVLGTDLDREGMIKMPLNLDARQGTDWKATLNVALQRLQSLDAAALALRSETDRYIRPIMLVQVERTGADQRAGGHIHADDVKDWLLTAGFDAPEIAIKTAEQNDLSQPENQDLLSPSNRVRAIITKAALQEGWDCPFAYVLCSLSASSNMRAMTQLVGRILRQPGALKTGITALDECHVITHHADTADVVAGIKGGLERDGLGDLVLSVAETDPNGKTAIKRKIDRRSEFASTDIYLPRVLAVENGEARDLDYDTDILAAIDWRGFDPRAIADSIPENAHAAESQLQRISLTDTAEHFTATLTGTSPEAASFDRPHAVRMISDIVPNPFVGQEIVTRALDRLAERGFSAAKIGALSNLIIEELRRGLDTERTNRAEALFKTAVAEGRIQFRLRIDGKNWRMPFHVETSEPENAVKLAGKTGGPLERSLFLPIYQNELNGEERDVAVHLDADKALVWWHRNVARNHYSLQGWRRARIYPDFIFAARRDGEPKRIVVLESKGDQLDNLDTDYKREVLRVMSDAFAWDSTVPAGTLQLVNNGETVECTLILMSNIPTKLPPYLAS